jgi:hypothetical protein
MSSQREPRRWHLPDEGVPARLRQAINAARSDLPPPSHLRAIAARVASRLAESSEDVAVASVALANSAGRLVANAFAMGSGSHGSRSMGGGGSDRDLDGAVDDGAHERPSEERSSIRRRHRERQDPGARRTR